ncbi:glycosyltransferase [Chitinimonas arctica]|uniref:Glycosyltransferase n=1 Tax=Chitinimonas arctica TaxID=2594795 RepID=A0A516SEG0_9NEIS|nr:nucleotide disphospho-sugar-binding domain-containing protein [Chitinimonas arctica]QDQ26523.1 glycosyltransferase [Chitinimonas arctica]
MPQPLHILINCVGSAGDVHPFIAIGEVLQRRGHTVELLTSPYFQDRIVRAGLGFVPVGTLEDYQRTVADPRLWQARHGFNVVWQAFQRHMKEGYRAIERQVRPGRTVLVGSTLAWHARIAQEKLGLPHATVHLSPSCLLSATAPPKLAGATWLSTLPPWLLRPLYAALERGVLDPMVLPTLNAFRARLALPPTRRVLSQWMNSPDKVICAFPDWFAPPQPDWPAGAVTTGFPRWSAPAGSVLDPMLMRFLQAGPPPIAFTPGSAMAHGRGFFERALAACDALGRRAVLISPFNEQMPPRLPAFAHHVGYVPFDLLLPHLAAIVHHGGIGTLAQALAAGVPQMITPFAHDQFDNAARLVKLGVASTVSPDAAATRWAKALLPLAGKAEACAQLAHAMGRPGEAAERIADQIESLHGAIPA